MTTPLSRRGFLVGGTTAVARAHGIGVEARKRLLERLQRDFS